MGKVNFIFTEYAYSKTIVLSIVLFLFVLILKKVVSFNLSKKELEYNQKIQLNKKLNQYLNYAFLLFLFVLWFAKIQIFFVSLLAVAAALVLAFKELIMCITGGIYLKSSGLFDVGDRIDIDGVRGFVIEKQFLGVNVLEIGPENNSQQTTGDVISIPNSIFLTKILKNESYFQGHSIKSYIFKFTVKDDIDSIENKLLEKAKEISRAYMEDAKKDISDFCSKEGIIIPSVEPRTKVLIEDTEKVNILVKLPVQNFQIADVEQMFNRLVLQLKQDSPDREEG